MTGFVGFPDGALDFFVELEADNERGWWLADKDRFDADVEELMRALLEAVTPDGGEDVLVRAPKGFSPDHPRIDLLRWKGCIASKELGAPAWLHTKRAAAEVAKVWARAEPVFAWLDAHVGPSLEPPPDR